MSIDSNLKTLAFSVPASHHCFAGHFPGNPLVPGALILAWVSAKLKAELGLEHTKIKHAKFTQAVKPGMQLSLSVSKTTSACNVKIVCPETQRMYASINYAT